MVTIWEHCARRTTPLLLLHGLREHFTQEKTKETLLSGRGRSQNDQQ